MYLFLDTETTGLTPDSRIVSICWALYDADAKHHATRYHIIYPDGFTIPAGATAVHGISTAEARLHGIPIADGLAELYEDIAANEPALYIGHNVSYDRPIVLNEYARLDAQENISPLPTLCTMKSTTNLCCIPRYNGGYKWPTLDELHRHLFHRPHTDAHSAEGDVRACAACFFELLSRSHFPNLPTPPRTANCPKCGLLNRIPAHRPDQTIHCGNCHTPL